CGRAPLAWRSGTLASASGPRIPDIEGLLTLRGPALQLLAWALLLGIRPIPCHKLCQPETEPPSGFLVIWEADHQSRVGAEEGVSEQSHYDQGHAEQRIF